MKKLKSIFKTLTTPLPPKCAKEFHEGFTKPMIAFAGGICIFAILLDYSFQLVEAIDILAR